MTDQERLDLAAAVSCLVGTYDEVLAIVRRQRDLAESAARHEAGNADHWRANHADQVARCALLRQRPDLPADRVRAYDQLVRLQAQVTALKGELEALAKDRDCLRAYVRKLEEDAA